MADTPFDIRDVLKFAQKKINEADTTTHSQDIVYLMKVAIRGDGNPIHMYDSTGELPYLLDDIEDPEQIAYVRDEQNLYFSNNRYWKPLLKDTLAAIFQGKSYGFTAGGGPISTDQIERYSFSSDINSIDVDNLVVGLNHLAGHSDTSNDDGYVSGGSNPATPAVNSDAIQKYSFTSSGSVSTTGTLTENKNKVSGVSDVVGAEGYTIGGTLSANSIEKFSFAASNSGADAGDLNGTSEYGASSSDTTGSRGFVEYGSTIDRFPFSSFTTATNIGSLSSSPLIEGTGNSSKTHGYVSGGVSPLGSDDVYKYPYSHSSGQVSAIGNLNINRLLSGSTGASSEHHGYDVGGNTSPSAGSTTNSIEKYSFQTDLTGIDVADLVSAKHGTAGAQY